MTNIHSLKKRLFFSTATALTFCCNLIFSQENSANKEVFLSSIELKKDTTIYLLNFKTEFKIGNKLILFRFVDNNEDNKIDTATNNGVKDVIAFKDMETGFINTILFKNTFLVNINNKELIRFTIPEKDFNYVTVSKKQDYEPPDIFLLSNFYSLKLVNVITQKESVIKDFLSKKYLIVNCWTSSCAPCIKELKYINNIDTTNYTIIHLLDPRSKEDGIKIYKDHNLDVEKLFNLTDELKNILGVSGFPYTILLDTNGNIIESTKQLHAFSKK